MKDTPEHAIHINEDFTNVDTRALDSKHRITLSTKAVKIALSKNKKIDAYQVLVGKSGDILLRPAVSIPASEAWIYENPKVIGPLRKGLNEAKQGKGKRVNNLDKFLESL